MQKNVEPRGPARKLRHATGALSLDHCLVMGILNRTPDSFYDGGRMDLARSVDHAAAMVAAGADILDVGAVKAGPGDAVSEDEELHRLLPLVEALRAVIPVCLSIETARPAVAARAFAAGASMVNDVSGLHDDALVAECAAAGGALVVMHHGGQIRGRPRHPRYVDVVEDVVAEWRRLVRRAGEEGVSQDSILVDPGLDFGKTTWHSLTLIRRLDELVAKGWPVLVAPSRKDVVGETLGVPLEARLEGSLALVAMAVERGASVVRVHDVEAAVRTVGMVEAVMGRRQPRLPLRGLWD